MTDADLAQCSAWFIVDADGTQSGPFTLDQLRSSKAYFDPDQTRVWCEYLDDWTLVDQVPFLTRAFSGQPVENEPDICELIGDSKDRPLPRVKFNEFVEVHALESFKSSAPALTGTIPKAGHITAAAADQPEAAPTTGLVRVQNALRVMNTALIGLGASKRRLLLRFPVIDLGRYIEDLERTAFASMTEDVILSQLCLEVTKERDSFASLTEEQQKLYHERSLSSAKHQNDEMVAAADELERESKAIIDAAFQVLQTESSNASQYGDLGEGRTLLDTAINCSRSEILYLRRLAERQQHLVQHAPLYVYYRTVMTAIMQYLLGMRLLQGMNGADHDRYKKVIKSDPILHSIVKKGIDIQGQTFAVARGDASTIMATVLDALLMTIHTNHVVIRSYYHHSTNNVQFVTSVQTCADTIAQTLTLRYEEQIRMLTCRSAQSLAEFGLRAMFQLMSKGIPLPEDNRNITLMVSHVVASVQDESALNKGSKMFAKKEKLLTIRGPDKDTWNAVGIYRKSGVRVYTDKGDAQRFFEGGLFEANPGKYGYRLGSISECETLKMVETTPNRHRPDMTTSCYDNSDRPTVNAFVLAPRGSAASPSTPMYSSNVETSVSVSYLDDKASDDDSLKLSGGDLPHRIYRLEAAVDILAKENLSLREELERIRHALAHSGLQV